MTAGSLWSISYEAVTHEFTKEANKEVASVWEVHYPLALSQLGIKSCQWRELYLNPINRRSFLPQQFCCLQHMTWHVKVNQ